MPKITKRYGDFTNGIASDATQVDAQINDLYSLLNSGIDDQNVITGGLTGVSIAPEAITPDKSKGMMYANDLFSSSFILSGGVPTKDGSVLNQINVPSYIAYIAQTDGTLRRIKTNSGSYQTTVSNGTYYLDLNPDGSFNWGGQHSNVSGYIPICMVVADASGNISTITDKRPVTINLLGNAAGSINANIQNSALSWFLR